MWLFVWDSEPSKIFVGDTPISKVFVWDTKVRPSVDTRTFTISWTEQTDMSSWWIYSDDAVGLTAWSTEFDKFFGYYWCRLSDNWIETAKVSQFWWDLDITQLWTLTSWDNVMIAFPLRWIKMSKSWSVVTLSITAEQNKAGYQYIAFMDNWVVKDRFYIWVYEWSLSNSKIVSLSWTTPNSFSLDSAVSAANAYWSWTRYHIQTIYTRWYIMALYMMKYGNPNVQSVIWRWHCDSAASTPALTSWLTDNYTAASWGGTWTQPCKLFWIENFWGNMNECTDGIGSSYSSSGTRHFNTNTTQAFPSSWRISTYNYSTPDWSGNNAKPIQTIVWTNEWMFAPASTQSSATQRYWDYASASNNYVVAMWGARNLGDNVWLFYYLSSYKASASDARQWSRLIYI